MGTWGTGAFENDDACDFASELVENGGAPTLAEALDRVVASEGDYLEAPEAQQGVAAAEIVARLRGQPGEQTPYAASIDAWIESSAIPASDELIANARMAVARVLTEPSELLELWKASGEVDVWKLTLKELSQRLS